MPSTGFEFPPEARLLALGFFENSSESTARSVRTLLENCIASTKVKVFSVIQATKGSWWMPWR